MVGAEKRGEAWVVMRGVGRRVFLVSRGVGTRGREEQVESAEGRGHQKDTATKPTESAREFAWGMKVFDKKVIAQAKFFGRFDGRCRDFCFGVESDRDGFEQSSSG